MCSSDLVLDLDKELVNGEMVDVMTLTDEHSSELEALLRKFAADTNSNIAAELLNNWEKSRTRFSLVMPRDYARVLAAIKRAEREGLSVDELVMEAAVG